MIQYVNSNGEQIHKKQLLWQFCKCHHETSNRNCHHQQTYLKLFSTQSEISCREIIESLLVSMRRRSTANRCLASCADNFENSSFKSCDPNSNRQGSQRSFTRAVKYMYSWPVYCNAQRLQRETDSEICTSLKMLEWVILSPLSWLQAPGVLFTIVRASTQKFMAYPTFEILRMC